MAFNGIVKSDGFSMEYIKFGKGERIFVILPGMSLFPVIPFADVIENQYACFADDFTVYLFERKNNIKTGYSVLDMAEDTVEAMKLLKIEKADICGMSQGGMMAVLMAVRYPDSVNSLLLCSSLARQNDVSTDTFSKWTRLCKNRYADELIESMADRIYSDNFGGDLKKSFIASREKITVDVLERFAVLSTACLEFDAFGQLDKISCPVCVIGADCDKTLSVIGSNEIVEKLGCGSYIYSGYGHAVYDEASDFTTRAYQFFTNV